MNVTKATVRKYNMRDSSREREAIEFWKGRSHEEKISVLEMLRTIWIKMNSEQWKHGDFKRFRRVLRIVKQA
ncbi:MAG: hypothetical protein HBSIN02_20680 [Bacteroidia bacterium]|nr:MAG: hypothetical protein HBSIN02_20680 [Bacteroidia bacterium]